MTMTSGSRTAELEAEVARLQKQVVHWKANHD